MIPESTGDGRWLVLCAALSVAAIVGFGEVSGWHRFVVVIVDPAVPYFGLALAAQTFALVAYAVAYRGVAAARGATLGPDDVLALTTAGFGAYLPAGGFRFDLRSLRKQGQSPESAKAIVVLLSLLEYAVLAPAAWVAAVLLLLRHQPVEKSMTLSWAIGVPAGTLVFGWLLWLHKRHKRSWGRLVPILSSAEFLLSMLGRIDDWQTFAGMACYWLADIFSLWASLRAFGADAGVAALVVAYASGYALSRRSMPLAGAGLTEVSLVLALTWAHTPLARAVPAVFAYRIFNIWVPTLTGLVAVKIGSLRP